MEGMKFDKDKPRYDLIPIGVEEEVAKVFTFGAKKYADNNWLLVEDGERRYYAACRRHIEAWRRGERLDPETGYHHLAHAICCLAILMGREQGNKCIQGGDIVRKTIQNLRPTIYAIDFDGTLCENKYPDIGTPNRRIIEFCIDRKEKGDKLILWTCRTGERLKEAVEWCKEQGLDFDAVNENLPERIAEFGGDTRKISADFYIDDKNMEVWHGN